MTGDPDTRRYTADDLARFEEELRQDEARLDELFARVTTPRPAPDDVPIWWTLPEELAGAERMLAEAQAELEEARAVARTCQAAIDEVKGVSPEDLVRLQEQHEAAQARVAQAEATVERHLRWVERARAGLPEDEEAELEARIARAEMDVEFSRRFVDSARADLLPEHCREALAACWSCDRRMAFSPRPG